MKETLGAIAAGSFCSLHNLASQLVSHRITRGLRSSALRMTVDWDCLVKPMVYAWELVLSAVVVIGTADKLLYTPTSGGGVRCALDDSIATCSAVIIIGGLLLLGAVGVLWRRLVAAFSDETFPGIDESGLCGILALGWLIVAAIITKNIAIRDKTAADTLTTMRNVIVTFAWLNFVSFIASALLAAYKPDVEDQVGFSYNNLQQQLHRDEILNPPEDTGALIGHPVGNQAIEPAIVHPNAEHDEYLESLHLRKADMPSTPFAEAVGVDADVETSVRARDAEIASWGRPRRRNQTGDKEDKP